MAFPAVRAEAPAVRAEAQGDTAASAARAADAPEPAQRHQLHAGTRSISGSRRDFFGGFHERGNSTVTVRDLPSSDSAWIFPRWTSVTALAMLSPRPKPPDSEFRELSPLAKRSSR